MLRTLTQEGFKINERELMRVRLNQRWYLRNPNGSQKAKRPHVSEDETVEQLQQAIFAADGQYDNLNTDHASPAAAQVQVPTVAHSTAMLPDPSGGLDPEVLKKRHERIRQLAEESEEKLQTKKRRRRTRGWAGMPADPEGPPRFPSETTIDESKVFLDLTYDQYREVRAIFQRLCAEANVYKKTEAGRELWEALKARLVQESAPLQAQLWTSTENIPSKRLGLDVICSDVTKRMRTLDRRMTIGEAKTALGVNPQQGRDLRSSFYTILTDDHFTSKIDSGPEHWNGLKQRWINENERLSSIVAQGPAGENYDLKMRAMDMFARDVTKRLRDDQTKRDPIRAKVKAPSAPTYPPVHVEHEDYVTQDPQQLLIQAAAYAQAEVQTQAHAQSQAQAQVLSQEHPDMQIDPSLLLAAANEPGVSLSHALPHTPNDALTHKPYPTHAPHAPDAPFSEQQYADQQYAAAAAQAMSSMAVYFRLHPDSSVTAGPRLWVSTLTSMSVAELRDLATVKYPGSVAVRVQGIIPHAGEGAELGMEEMGIQVDSDEEVHAYLAAVNGVKPTFSVVLVGKW